MWICILLICATYRELREQCPYESAEAVVPCSACGVCREAVKPYGGLEHGVTEDDRFAQSRVYEQRMHAALGNYVKEQGEGWKSNPVFVDQYGARHVPDAVTANGTILELKPNSPSGRAAGKRQKARYEAVTGQAVQILYYEPPVEFSEGEMEWTKLKGVLGRYWISVTRGGFCAPWRGLESIASAIG